jgi:phosphatidylserine decarboxylase
LLKRVFVPIHPAGWPFIALFALIAVGLCYLAQPLGILGAVLTLWCIYFFRNPPRVTPVRPGLVISPADGVVERIDSAAPPPELGMGSEPMARIAVFMNVFDVHVNRSPVDGTVSGLSYRPGKFFNASLDKASVDNERQSLRITTADGVNIAVCQIAGLIARRILCDVGEGQPIKAGERFGMIRFGSRVDVYLPQGTAILAVTGQRAVAGETVLADLNRQESPLSGEIR